VFFDQNSKLDEILDENIVSYIPKSGLASFDEQAIHRFRVKQAQVCKEIVFKDYNYREPHLPMLGTAETGDLGYGRQYAYGEHFKSTEAARCYRECLLKVLAKQSTIKTNLIPCPPILYFAPV
jgi:uncharacterized protein involved in type VI secretion and phage assembly